MSNTKPILIKDLGLEYATSKSKRKQRMGIYLCPICKNEYRAYQYTINKGSSTRCKKCSNKTHNMTGTRLHGIWLKMKDRCNNINSVHYIKYGKRGIKVCDEWNDSFECFLLWANENGYTEKLTIDRINNNGNYEPSNCRWTTKSVQSRNTKRIYKNNTTGYRGVCRNGNGFSSKITVNRKTIYLGTYKTDIDAAKAYDKYVIEKKLEHTRNFND